MSNEQGILNKENTKAILSGVDRSFFNGGFSKLGSGATKVEDPKALAMSLLHHDNVLSSGASSKVEDMDKVREVVNNAESQYVANKMARQQGGMQH